MKDKVDIDFECVGCGKCCKSHGHVYLTTKDCVILAGHLDLSVTRFKKEYCARTEGEWHLREPETDCCFLDGSRCAVYKVRPEQCRTWPYWEENFRKGKVKKTYVSWCKGVRIKE